LRQETAKRAQGKEAPQEKEAEGSTKERDRKEKKQNKNRNTTQHMVVQTFV